MPIEINAQKIKLLREKLGETQAAFAKRIGISRESVINYEKGSPIPESKRPLLESLLKQIESVEVAKLLVPYYNVDFSDPQNMVLEQAASIAPDYFMDIPEFAGCTAFRTYSDSMESKIKSGSVLFGTDLNAWRRHLEYGQIYGIVCNDGRKYLKYIRRHPDNPEDYFLLQSENPSYDTFSLPKDVIVSVWLIHGWLNKRT